MKVLNLHILFKENAECLAEELNTNVISNLRDIEQNETVYIFGGHTDPMELMKKQIRKKLEYVIIQTENLESAVFTTNLDYLNLLSSSKIWEWSYYNKEYLEKKYKFNIEKIYDFKFRELQNISEKNLRDIDLFFCGMENEYRKEILTKIKETYPTLKCFFSLNYNLTDPEQLNKILSRSKYILNIPFYKPGVLATHRINKALCCGCKVISENSCDEKLDETYSSNENVKFTDDIISQVGEIFNET